MPITGVNKGQFGVSPVEIDFNSDSAVSRKGWRRLLSRAPIGTSGAAKQKSVPDTIELFGNHPALFHVADRLNRGHFR
jgi:hypothetical protein